MGSSNDSCFRTRSGLVRRKSFMDSSDDSCSRTRSGLVRRKRFMDSSDDSCSRTRSGFVRRKNYMDSRDDSCSRTRSGLVRRKSFMDSSDGSCSRTRSGLVRGSPSVKALTMDGPVKKGLPDTDGQLIEEIPSRTRSGLVRQAPIFKREDAPVATQSGLARGNLAIKASSSSQQTRPSTADKGIQCEILTSEGIMLPWGELYTPHREKNTEHTMLPESESMEVTEEYGNKIETLQQNGVQPFTAHCAPRQTESIKREDQNVAMESKKNKTEANPTVTPIRLSPCLAALNAPSESSIKPEDRPTTINHINQLHNVEDNNNDQSEMCHSSNMNKICGNGKRTFSQLWSNQEDAVHITQAMQEKTTNDSQPSQANTVNHIQMNLESIDHQVRSSLAGTGIPMLTVHKYGTDQPNQVDNMNHKQTNVENTINQLQSSLADTSNYRERNQENTAQSGLENTVIPIQTMRKYTTNQLRQSGNMNHIQSSLADTIVPIRFTQDITSDHSQLSSAGSITQKQANQRNTADQCGQADSVPQIQMMQDNMTNQSHLSQANSLNQIHINLQNTSNHLEPNYAENPSLEAGFSWDAEENDGALVTDFWRNVGSQDVPTQIDGVPVAMFQENVKFQNAAAPAAAEPVIPKTQATMPVTVPDQSGVVAPSLFGNSWSDPCIEFAFKTLTGDIPVLDDTAAVTNCFPQLPDLNKGTSPNCSASALHNNRTHTQADVNLPLPRPSDKLCNGSWFPPQ